MTLAWKCLPETRMKYFALNGLLKIRRTYCCIRRAEILTAISPTFAKCAWRRQVCALACSVAPVLSGSFFSSCALAFGVISCWKPQSKMRGRSGKQCTRKASCQSTLCGWLFNYFEREATSLPSGAVRQQLDLPRCEQQLVARIAQGLMNKEIANRFCLSEQTVMNHLCRMKHVGADNRLGIVQTCHRQGFLLYLLVNLVRS